MLTQYTPTIKWWLNLKWRIEMNNEHYDKYEALSQKIGIEALRAIIPVTKEKIRAALENGDEHLNSISLHLWDKAAGMIPKRNYCTTKEFYVSWESPFTSGVANGLSLAERVCILKHVAQYHY
uniref:Uncharacterized protein n=1 Tax=viral metagenome TaxID=1070528 RepID=A0A6M3LSB9_9ZZZZ